MRKIVLISCVSKKLDFTTAAENMYISPLFKYAIRYAKSMNPDKIFILSAKYGLLNLNDIIDPYDITLNEMSSHDVKIWANVVLEKLRRVSDLSSDKFIFLAGSKYRKYLIPHIKNCEIPLQGLGIGKQLKFLKGGM